MIIGSDVNKRNPWNAYADTIPGTISKKFGEYNKKRRCSDWYMKQLLNGFHGVVESLVYGI